MKNSKNNLTNKKRHNKKNIYLGYYLKLFFLVILFILTALLSYIFINKSLFIQEEKNIFYEEYGTPDYKVYLKNNIYYDEKYLEKDMSYIANLIDYILIDYNYKFTSNTLLSGEYYYKISADLEITNPVNNSLYYSKNYLLLDEKKIILENQKEYTIHENIRIDYDNYNFLANSFKSSYGINTESNLKVYLEIHRRIEEELVNNSKINSDDRINLIIPLSEKAINIKMDSLEIRNQKVVLSLGLYKIDDVKYLILGLISLIITIVIFIIITKKVWFLQYKNSTYDKLLKKILRQYDRLIVNTNSMLNMKDYNVTEVEDFLELLDARYNIHKPIYYYEVTPHQKCYFFIKSDNNLMIYILKK